MFHFLENFIVLNFLKKELDAGFWMLDT